MLTFRRSCVFVCCTLQLHFPVWSAQAHTRLSMSQDWLSDPAKLHSHRMHCNNTMDTQNPDSDRKKQTTRKVYYSWLKPVNFIPLEGFFTFKSEAVTPPQSAQSVVTYTLVGLRQWKIRYLKSKATLLLMETFDIYMGMSIIQPLEGQRSFLLSCCCVQLE